ncbi:unnamed protein product [marine sediment metagenome]|uniref:Uncharacterized protein n=1 Tax=marine sediment metagenome TaxID=412755 RepID=X1DWG9_9ZZZZ
MPTTFDTHAIAQAQDTIVDLIGQHDVSYTGTLQLCRIYGYLCLEMLRAKAKPIGGGDDGDDVGR